ncbi:ETC complex I subunit [Microvirga sp. W0021]|uniref:ETC complex I subunit n=1 Tax=Hohaiivirga grylli TaxID=3133970 RepID=A0ABV0BJ24_9HYPH
MFARIFKPSKDASQSGLAGTRKWVLLFEPSSPKSADTLMGWTTSSDTRQQIRLSFDTQEEAVAYAQKQGIPYRVEKSHEARRRIATYSDNFKFDRVAPWTH